MTDSTCRPTVRICHDATVMPILPYAYDDSMFSPGPFWRFIGGIYADGEPISEALMVRIVELTDGRWRYQPMQAEMQAPYLEPERRFAGAHLYCGRCFPQFAHFITESLARIWLAKQHPDWTLVWTGAEAYLPWQREILDVLGIRSPTRFITQPTRLETLAVPSAGHLSPTFYTPYYLAALAVVDPVPVVPGRRVYLSRSSGNTGGYVNEQAVDAFLADNGWEILRPEALPVADRFDLLSSAEIILMIEGAAFTSFLLYRHIRSKVYILSRGDPERFFHEVWFGEFFGAAAMGKQLDYRRLALPKRLVANRDHAARYALDIQQFSELMRATNQLSTRLDLLDPYTSEPPVDSRHVRQLAEAAVQGVQTAVSAAIAHIYRSGLHEAAGDMTAASCEAAAALAAQPDNVFALGLHARLAENAGDLAEAERSLARALSLDRRVSPGPLMTMAGIKLRTGKPAEAAEHARRATELAPENGHCWAGYGDALAKDGQATRARQALEKATALLPEHVGVLHALSHICARSGDFAQAVRLMQRAIDEDSAQADFHRSLGDWQQTLGNLAEAALAYRQALALEPDDEHTVQALAELRRQQA